MLEKIKSELTIAMKEKNVLKVNVLRGLLAGFTNELVAQKKKPQDKLTEVEMLAVIKRAVKQRKDSIEQFQQGGRSDLAENEKAELEILEEYLPAMMSRADIKKIAEKKKEELGVEDKSKMGVLIGAVLGEIKTAGKNTDGGEVKTVVEELLN